MPPPNVVTPLALRVRRADERRKFADSLRSGALSPLQAGISGTARNPIQTKVSPFEAISKVLQAGLAYKAGKDSDTEYDQIATQMAGERAKALQALGGQASKSDAALQAGVDPSILKQIADAQESALTRKTTERGQDIGASTALSGQRNQFDIAAGNRGTQERGQDISAGTALRSQDISASTAARGQDVTMRGQDISAASAAAAAGKKPLTEYQSKAVGQLNRMQGAEQQLQKLQSDGFAPGYADKIAGSVPGVGNVLTSKNQQLYLQSANEFIAGILRLDSGAAVPEAEFERYFKTYFPQPGDEDETVKQKAVARQRAMDSLRIGLGNASNLVNRENSPPPGNNGGATSRWEDDPRASNAMKYLPQ